MIASELKFKPNSLKDSLFLRTKVSKKPKHQSTNHAEFVFEANKQASSANTILAIKFNFSPKIKRNIFQ